MEGDVETPTRMVGKKVVPILQKEEGVYMPESMDIVHYVDQLEGSPVITGECDPAIDALVQREYARRI
ncbi:Glutaredoxin-2 [Leclercia adecarboxylata]|uniref:Glutaredoxin-2 n=1 Tax=Leclercia adecarboxylata TaxID=83655 RepID=A0A4U9HU61_9ENTR|nr:Glutaredoxin-2 [Leclercia adecarboxylata]